MNPQEHARAGVIQALGQLTLQAIEQQAQIAALNAELQGSKEAAPREEPRAAGVTDGIENPA